MLTARFAFIRRASEKKKTSTVNFPKVRQMRIRSVKVEDTRVFSAISERNSRSRKVQSNVRHKKIGLFY